MKRISTVGMQGKRNTKRHGAGRLAGLLESLESRMLMSTVTVAPVGVMEGNTMKMATMTARLNAASASNVVVVYSTMDATAKAGVNYAKMNSYVVIPAGQTSATFNIPILANTLQQGTTSFGLNLAVSAGNRLTQNRTSVYIADDDADPELTVSSAGVEAGGTANFQVSLSQATATPVTLRYHTKSMTPGADFTAVNSLLTIPAGQTSGTISIQTRDWGNARNDMFALVLDGATNATVTKAVAWGTIIPANATVSVGDTSMTEGDSGVATMTFTVSLSKASSRTVTVDYETADGGGVSALPQVGIPGNAAHEGSDYTATSGTLTFAPGQTSKTVTVTVDGDTNIEQDEKLRLMLSNASNATLGSAIGIGTITNDDVPSVSIAPASVTETAGSVTSTTLTYTVTLSHTAPFAVTVDYATSDGSAEAGSDYTATNGTLTFAPGETSKTIDVAITATDLTLTSTEAFDMTLSNASHATLGTATAAGTIDLVDPILSDNLGESSNGDIGAGPSQWPAASFTTGSSSVDLVSVTIPVFIYSPGTPTMRIFSDAAGQPGSAIGTLTSPGVYGSNSVFTASGITLSANTKYWVVLESTGDYGWVITNSNSGTGAGFTGEALVTTNSGSNWFGTATLKMQVQVQP